MLTVCWRTLADIHGNIQYYTFHATNKFRLSEWWTLEMKPSHHTIRGHAFIVLYEIDFTNFLLKLTL